MDMQNVMLIAYLARKEPGRIQDFGNWQLPDVSKPIAWYLRNCKSENIKLRRTVCMPRRFYLSVWHVHSRVYRNGWSIIRPSLSGAFVFSHQMLWQHSDAVTQISGS